MEGNNDNFLLAVSLKEIGALYGGWLEAFEDSYDERRMTSPGMSEPPEFPFLIDVWFHLLGEGADIRGDDITKKFVQEFGSCWTKLSDWLAEPAHHCVASVPGPVLDYVHSLTKGAENDGKRDQGVEG